MIDATIECLIACNIAVAAMPNILTQIKASESHELFLDKKLDEFGECKTHYTLFGKLNLYWNYLAYDLLYQLIKVLYGKHPQAFEKVHKEMTVYKSDMEMFKSSTSLKLFCAVQPMPLDIAPPGFKEVVGEFEWPKDITLEAVEKFQQRYARHYRLRECAMIVNSIIPGSFKVTWFLPISIIDILAERTEDILDLFVEFNVMKLTLNGNCIYESQKHIYSGGATSIHDPTQPILTGSFAVACQPLVIIFTQNIIPYALSALIHLDIKEKQVLYFSL